MQSRTLDLGPRLAAAMFSRVTGLLEVALNTDLHHAMIVWALASNFEVFYFLMHSLPIQH